VEQGVSLAARHQRGFSVWSPGQRDGCRSVVGRQ